MASSAVARQGVVVALALLFLGILPGLGEAQEGGAAAPLQVLVDALPRLVDNAIFEAERDATPDAAERIAADMREYVRGFEDGSVWPPDADASSLPMTEALVYATDVVELASRLPGDVARVARNGAACASWQDNVTADEVLRWAFQTRPSSVRLQATTLALSSLKDATPLPLDTAPIDAATGQLDAWLARDVAATRGCLSDTAVRLGVPLEPGIPTLSVVPERVHLLGTVRLLGGILDPAPGTTVRLLSEPLGLDEEIVLPAAGTFFLRHAVDAETPLGVHTVVLVGPNNTTTDTVEVTKIPTRLVVSGPDNVAIGLDFSLRFTVTTRTTLAAPSGNVTVTGSLQERFMADDGTATVPVVGEDEPGFVRGAASYEGDALFAGSSSDYSVRVFDPDDPEAGRLLGLEGEDETLRAPPEPRGGRDVVGGGNLEFLGVRIPFIFDYETPAWVGLILVAILVFVLWEGLVALRAWQLRRARRRSGMSGGTAAFDSASAGELGVASAPVAGASPSLSGRLSYGGMFASFHGWLVRVRLARRNETAREVALRYASKDPDLVAGVVAFERVRYGGHSESSAATPSLGRRLLGTWRRVLRVLRP